MQRAVDAGFGGVSLFAFGYEDEATWNAIDAISRQLRSRHDVDATDHRRRLIGQDDPMKVHLVDGTYELFRQNFGRAAKEPDAGPYAATSGVLMSTLQLLADGATHVGVASDHIIESFRNDLWPGYKTSAGMPPELLAQIPMVEEALVAMGVTTWAMVEHEADDALGAAAADRRRRRARRAGAHRHARQGPRPVRARHAGRAVRPPQARDRSTRPASIAKFGVPPASIPDYLGLVGDSADGFPGIAGWGAKSAAAVLARYGHLEDIPDSAGQWDVPGLRGAAKLSRALRADFELALLFRRIATVELDVEVGTVDDWAWTGPTPGFDGVGRPASTSHGWPSAPRAGPLAPPRLSRQRFVSSAGTSGATVWAPSVPSGSSSRAADRVRHHRQRAHRVAVDEDVRGLARRGGQPGDVQQRDEVVRRRVGQLVVGVALDPGELGRARGHQLGDVVVEAARPVERRLRLAPSRSRRRLCTTLPLPTISTPRSRSGASWAPSATCSSNGFVALIASCRTGMSASGKACTSTDHVPWSMPQLSASSPTHVGRTSVGDLLGEDRVAERRVLDGEQLVGKP